MRGTCGIGIFQPEFDANVGSLIRSARCFDADYVFTVGGKWSGHPTACGHEGHIPIHHYEEFEWRHKVPDGAVPVRVDYTETAAPLSNFHHPEKAVYLLGNEGCGFDYMDDPPANTVYIPSEYCLNVAVAASIVLQDRYSAMHRPSSTSGIETILS